MPATIDQPATVTATPTAPDTGIAHGAPSTGAAPSNFRPPNPAFDKVTQRLSERLSKKSVPAPVSSKPSETPASAAKETPPAVKPTETPASATDAAATDTTATPTTDDVAAPETETATADKPATETPASADAKPAKKVSPWRLVDEYKKTTTELRTRAESLERELTELKAGKATAAPPKELTDRLDAAERKVREYEDHLRFVDYQRHPEFVEKYQRPYEAAWQRATSELAEVAVTDPATGAVRGATAEDMLALVNLPLGKAREYANQIFGDFADDAMAHRKEIKGLADTQKAALEEAKSKGLERQKAMETQTAAQQAELAKSITEAWSAANREAVTDEKYGKFFAPVEGDQDGNASLAKGFELVDKAFREDPRDPAISAEERAARVKRHAAMRNRAAAFGRMRKWIEQRDARIKELEERLDAYAESEPTTGANTAKPAEKAAAPVDAYARLEAKLRGRAR